MRSTVIIEKRGAGYVCTASGKFGGGYQMARAGLDPQAAALFAAREMIRYSQSNDEGGDLMATPEVLELVPEHLRRIDAKSNP
jgi:hypothetical protein